MAKPAVFVDTKEFPTIVVTGPSVEVAEIIEPPEVAPAPAWLPKTESFPVDTTVFPTDVVAGPSVEVAEITEPPEPASPAPAVFPTTSVLLIVITAGPSLEVAVIIEPPEPALAPAWLFAISILVESSTPSAAAKVTPAGPDVEVAEITAPPVVPPVPATLAATVPVFTTTVATPSVEVADTTAPPVVPPEPAVLLSTDAPFNVTVAASDVEVAEITAPPAPDVPPSPAAFFATDAVAELISTVAAPAAAVTVRMDPPELRAEIFESADPAWFDSMVVDPEMLTAASPAALTVMTDPPAPDESVPAVLPEIVEFVRESVALPAEVLTTITEPPALVASPIAAELFVMLEFVIVTVVDACPLTRTADAPFTSLISTLVSVTVTGSVVASTLTAGAASKAASKIKLFKVTVEFEQIMQVPGVLDEDWIVTFPPVPPSISRIRPIWMPPAVVTVVLSAPKVILVTVWSLRPPSNVFDPVTSQSTAFAACT